MRFEIPIRIEVLCCVIGIIALQGCGADEGAATTSVPPGSSAAPFGSQPGNTSIPGGTTNTGLPPAFGGPVGAPGSIGGPAPGLDTSTPPADVGFMGGMGGTPSAPGDVVVAGAGGEMPCEVSAIVQKACQNCHAATPVFGAPMPLVSPDDFQRDYMAMTTTQLSGQTMKTYELVRIRVNAEMGTRRMPQGEALSETELATLNEWLSAGAPAGAACDPSAGGAVTDMGGAVAPTSGDNIEDQCLNPGAFEPLVSESPDETCYDFAVHGRSGVGDTSPFPVGLNESYSEFYYKVPWPQGSLATRFGTKYDKTEVLHHWLMFANNNVLGGDGVVSPNVTGSTLGTDSELIAGWAVGGCTTRYPDDVGVALPQSLYIMVQWHHYNTTRATVGDNSAAQICVVPAGSRPNTAGLTFLGTERISVPPGAKGTAFGTCINTTNQPITIIGFNPHMHTIGVNMKSEVKRAGAAAYETVFDKSFVFDYQTNYILQNPIVLQPGDTIKSTCEFQNSGARNVGFGQSTNQEMCYQFTLSYPYGALNNGVPSLIGASNTCWQFGE